MTGFSGPLCPPHFNMARYCLTHANAPADAIALEVLTSPVGAPDECWTYDDLTAAVLDAAARLRHLARARNQPERQHVVLALGNTSAFPIYFFGAIAAGLVAVPLSDQLTREELIRIADELSPLAILTDDRSPALPSALTLAALETQPTDPADRVFADTCAQDPAFVIYTSGTTARPKGVKHAQRSAWGRRPMYDGWYGISPSDRMLHAGAFNWTYTLGTGLADPWANGATALIFTGDKQPEHWPQLISNHNVTIFAAVPGIYRQILKYGDAGKIRDSKLRHGLVAGERLAASIRDTWFSLTGTPLYEALGMSEISTYISSGPSAPPRPPAIGKAQPGRAIAILPDPSGDNPTDEAAEPTTPLPTGTIGRLAVHRTDPGLMLGYWNRPEEEAATRVGDWFVGGDLAHIDEDGYVHHHGRADDLMNAQGYRVAPEEVEAALASHPGVDEVVVTDIAVSDEISVICAFVVPTGCTCPDLASLRDHASAHIATYKLPREVMPIDAVPRTRNGKIQRKSLKLLYAQSQREKPAATTS